ncbi:MAG: ABC transporter permease [Bifidobacteriaceae bacterium]|jgi:putative ABC transport system permease protein|nr:ABC transporter permease [Bifidobacteriaceae bacterium]
MTPRRRRDGADVDSGDAPPGGTGRKATSRQLRPRIRVVDALSESVASVAARPGRSMLTMTGTILGCAAFIAIIGLTTTAAGQITSAFNELEATTVTVVDSAVEASGEPGYSFPDQVGPLMRQLNGVVDAGVYAQAPYSSALSSISIRPEVDGAGGSGGSVLSVYGAEPGTLTAARAEWTSGHGFDQFHVDTHQPVAVLGFAAAARLGIASVVTHPTVFVGNTAYAVIGVMAEGGALPELGNAVTVPITTMIDSLGPPASSDPARVLIRTRMGAAALISTQAPFKLRPDNPEALTAIAPPDWSMITDDVDTSMNGLLLALAGIALIIGCVAIANTTLVAVMERTGEIGLRQALGAKPGHILSQFLLESIMLGGIGGLLGSAVGIAAVLTGSMLQSWSPVLDPRLSLASPAIGVVVGALAGLYPSWRASRITPVAALQHS